MITTFSIALIIVLSIIAIGLIILAVILSRLSCQIQCQVNQLQNDFHQVSKEITHLLDNINKIVQSDMHQLSKDAGQLINNLSSLVSDITGKPNFLFKPLLFLKSKLSGTSEPTQSSPDRVTIPQLVGWITTGITLIKKTKELINNYEKAK